MLQDLVEQGDVEGIIGEGHPLNIADKHAIGTWATASKGSNLLPVVLDPPCIAVKVIERAYVIPASATAIDDFLAWNIDVLSDQIETLA